MNQETNPLDEEDEYETEAQATQRVRREQLAKLADGLITLPIPEVRDETLIEYAAFNQAEYFEPLFASGEIHSALRHMLDDPLFTSNNLRSAVRFADMRNQERSLSDGMGKYGPVVVKVRTIVRAPWTEVSYDDVDRVRGR